MLIAVNLFVVLAPTAAAQDYGDFSANKEPCYGSVFFDTIADTAHYDYIVLKVDAPSEGIKTKPLRIRYDSSFTSILCYGDENLEQLLWKMDANSNWFQNYEQIRKKRSQNVSSNLLDTLHLVYIQHDYRRHWIRVLCKNRITTNIVQLLYSKLKGHGFITQPYKEEEQYEMRQILSNALGAYQKFHGLIECPWSIESLVHIGLENHLPDVDD